METKNMKALPPQNAPQDRSKAPARPYKSKYKMGEWDDMEEDTMLEMFARRRARQQEQQE